MELRHLRYFVEAAEAENVSRASLKLHVSQPALSRQIHDLEDELGFPLFDRSAKSVRLTEAGRVFLGEAHSVLQRVEQAITVARVAASGRRTEIHVGYAPSPTARILPSALRAFQSQLPGVRVRLHDLSTEEMLAGVREGKLQISLFVRPTRSMLRGLHFQELMREPMCLAVPPKHSLARLRSVALNKAANEALVVFTRKDYPEYHDYLATLFAAAKSRPKIAEEHDSAASLIAAVESGVGVAIVPRSFACSAGRRLRLIPLVPAPEPLVIGGVWIKDLLSPAAQAFWECAKAAVSKLKGRRAP